MWILNLRRILSVNSANKLFKLHKLSVSNFKRPANLKLQENHSVLMSEILSKNDINFKDFKFLRNKVIEMDRNISDINVDSIVVGFCTKEAKLDVAKHYICFLKDQNIEINFATYGKLLRLYYLHSQKYGNSQQNEEEILAIFQKLIEKQNFLDGTTAENSIYALSITTQWKKSLELLQMIKFTSSPTAGVYSRIIVAAFLNGEWEIGWKLMYEMLLDHRIPYSDVYISWFQNCSRTQEDLEKMLHYIGNNNILVSKDVATEIAKAFFEIGYVGKLSKVNRYGKCSACTNHLSRIQISSQEFHKLAKKFLQKVLIRSDVYLKTNPEELSNFARFVDKTIPYDCVIDGLNVAYSCGSSKSPVVLAKTLSSVVKYFTLKGKHVLVLGRKHMNKWPKDHMNYIRRMGSIFLTENLSQDDPFLLYAALRSGPDTDIFSRDLMRGHSFLLDDEEKNIFLRWQQKHQYSLIHANESGKIIVKSPIEFQINAHKLNGNWHIPIESEDNFSQPSTLSNFELPSSWLCLFKFQQ